jgi:hypothetical protein
MGQTDDVAATRGDTLFKDGTLALETLADIKAHLSAAGAVSTRMQSCLLARELESPDANALWSLLMWNTSPSVPLRKRLRQWIDAGMPIRSGAGNCDTGRTKPASARSRRNEEVL